MSERKSGKQRRAEIRRKRLERAERLASQTARPDPRWPAGADRAAGAAQMLGVVPADRDLLARYNNTYGLLPEHYRDRAFVCRDCGQEQVWTAKQQKWWYEVAHGPIDSVAVRCLPCRRARRDRAEGGDLLREACARLRALGAPQPDNAARREVEDALVGKWWGVRTVAIAKLGQWGDNVSVARLKAIVEETRNAKRWGGWDFEARRAAIAALGECLPASDSDWAIELFLADAVAWELHPLLSRLPSDALDALFAAEWRRGEPERLCRLIWPLSRAPVDAARLRQWGERFRSHADAGVRRIAAHIWPDATPPVRA